MHSTIDSIYATQNLKNSDTNTIPNNLSDHEMLSLTLRIKIHKPKGNGFWKLNTSILQQKIFKEIFQNFYQNWQHQKAKYHSVNQWWKSGKIYFKILAIESSKNQNQKINTRLQKLTIQIIQEKKNITQPK